MFALEVGALVGSWVAGGVVWLAEGEGVLGVEVNDGVVVGVGVGVNEGIGEAVGDCVGGVVPAGVGVGEGVGLGCTRYGRIISLSSWSIMWQCQT